MTTDHEMPDSGQTLVVDDMCTWYIDGYFLIGRDRVIWMTEHAAQLHVRGMPSIRITGHPLRRLRHALAMSGMPQMTCVQREEFAKQCRYVQTEHDRPLLDEANEALLAKLRRTPLEQALDASLVDLPTDADLNRALIKEKLEKWRSGAKVEKRAPWEQARRPAAIAGEKVKLPVAGDSARAETLAALRQFGRRANKSFAAKV